ncbi:MAG: alpha/beta hydrolase [Acidobacteria bacterium]|nr:alpha/beta hydrolase [Acidobacteriota bacterium]
MRLRLSRAPRWLSGIAAVLVAAAVLFLLWQRYAPHRITVTEGKFPEELVYVRSTDDIVNGGVMFTASTTSVKPIAVLWIHGWGTNFYSPTYAVIGRALGGRGYTTISGNTRMHDLGNVAGYRNGRRIRGGGYWGVASEEVRDLAAWIDFAEDQGFKQVVLIGHSAGWAAVRSYQAEQQDSRVIGVVLASGAVRAETRPTDPDQLTEAKRLMAAGEGDALIRDPKRSFPSYVSAATFLDIANSPPESKDFFGVQTQTPNPGVTRIRCPLLAFFGTRGDVGNEEDLELLRSSIQRQRSGPSRVDTVMIRNADHMYTGEETQVAERIAEWANTLPVPSSSARRGVSENR